MPANTTNLGYLLAKATQRWNELLYDAFRRHGYADVRAAYSSILFPLFEHEGLQMSELARRARLSKQTMTTLVGDMRRKGLVRRIRDPDDGRAYRIYLSSRARRFREVAERVLADLDTRVERALSTGAVPGLRRSLVALMDLEDAAPGGETG